MSEETDWQLIQACRRGEGAAWNRVVEKYERLVFSVVLNYGVTQEDAADICQLTFTILIQQLDHINREIRLGAWLVTVAKRHTWRLLARRRRESVPDEGDLSENVQLASGEGAGSLARWELAEWLEGGLMLLDERCRRLLLALYFEADRPSYTDIAERLNMSVGSIGPTRARCLQRLKLILEEPPR